MRGPPGPAPSLNLEDAPPVYRGSDPSRPEHLCLCGSENFYSGGLEHLFLDLNHRGLRVAQLTLALTGSSSCFNLLTAGFDPSEPERHKFIMSAIDESIS